MKSYIRPKIIVYKINIESLLAAESGGQLGEGDAKNNNGLCGLKMMTVLRLLAIVFGMTTMIWKGSFFIIGKLVVEDKFC